MASAQGSRCSYLPLEEKSEKIRKEDEFTRCEDEFDANWYH